jgi:hypothetical protein
LGRFPRQNRIFREIPHARKALFDISEIPTAIVYSITPASLKFLSELEGEYPADAKVFANPAMKARLSDLLKKNAALVPERFQTGGPIQKSGDMVAMSGNKAHQGGIDEAMIAVGWMVTRTDHRR